MTTLAPPDVVVVGGGIVGALAAYLLAKEGARVTIVERDAVGSHASGFAFGGLSPLGGSSLPGQMLDFGLWSLRRHISLAPELGEAAGVDLQFRYRDELDLAFTDAEARQLRQYLSWQRPEAGLRVAWLDAAEACRVEPRANPAIAGALHVQGGASVEAYRYNLAAAQAAEKLGATLLLRRVTGLLAEGDRCRGVTFDRGQLEAGAVLLALGPWTAEAGRWLGVNIPVRPLKGQIARLQAGGAPLRVVLNHAHCYAAAKPDGLIWAGTTEEEAGFDEQTTIAARDSIIGHLLKMAPSLAEAQLARQTACLRPLSSDGRPIVGAVPGWRGLHVGTGAGRNGILWSPAMAQGLADTILRGRTAVPAFGELGLERFARA